MFDFLAALVSKLAISVLEALLARHDLSESVKKGIELDAKDRLIKALGWAMAHDDPGGLHDRGGTIILISPSSPASKASSDSL